MGLEAGGDLISAALAFDPIGPALQTWTSLHPYSPRNRGIEPSGLEPVWGIQVIGAFLSPGRL